MPLLQNVFDFNLCLNTLRERHSYLLTPAYRPTAVPRHCDVYIITDIPHSTVEVHRSQRSQLFH